MFLLTDFPPFIEQQPYSQMVEFYFDLSLRCDAIGDDLKYQWIHNGNAVIPNGHYNIINGTTLFINNVNSSDSGQYQCLVSNKVERVTSSNATVLVVEKGDL